MKTRIVILASFVLLFVACAKDKLPLVDEPELPRPELALISPSISTEYGANIPVPIKGSIADQEIIKTLSLIIYTDESAKDTVFHKDFVVENHQFSFDESWSPSSLDFTGSSNIYLLEIRIKHESTSEQPFLSFFQGIRAYR